MTIWEQFQSEVRAAAYTSSLTIRIFVDEKVIEIPPSGEVARVSTLREPAGTVNGIPVLSTKFGQVEGLPDPESSKFYIVSTIVQQAAPWRKDLLSPDTSPESVVRDVNGNIIGVRALSRLR
jgi:hypothetical protein